MLSRRNVILGTGATALAGSVVYGAGFGHRNARSYDEAARSVWAPRTPGRGDFDLAYLVHYATRAANSHNTQPWLFRRTGSGVSIAPDFRRRTPVADADNHHIFASLGCACENLALAAHAAGRGASVRFHETQNVEHEAHVEVDLARHGSAKGPGGPLFEAILQRQCTRSIYDGIPVANATLQTLEAAARVDGCRVLMIAQRSRMEQALDLIVAANNQQVEDPLFAAELQSWLRFNAAHAIEKSDGLYSACSGNPALSDWLGGLLFRLAFTPRSENERYVRQLRSSAGLAVFVSDKDDQAHWVQAGRSYQRFALQATALGVRHAFVNQPVEVAAFRPQVAAWLGLGDRRPDLIVRYGYAPPMPRSLRRPVSDVIVG